MSKLSVILPKTRNDYVLVKQFCGSIREKSSQCICSNGSQTEKSGKTCLEIAANSAKFCSNLSKETFVKHILKPFSLTSQSYGLSFSTTSCLEKGDKRKKTPLSNKFDLNCDDSKEKVKDLEECPEDCEETTKPETSKESSEDCKETRRKKEKRKQRKRSKKHKEDDCEDDGKQRKKKEKKNVECDDSKGGKSSAMKRRSRCKPAPRKYKDPYKKEGAAGYLASLLKCGPKQCKIMMGFLVSSLMFYLATLALLFYCTDWKPWKKEEEPPEPKKKVKEKKVEVRETVEEKPIVVETPNHEETVTKHIEVLDVECICGDHGDDNIKKES